LGYNNENVALDPLVYEAYNKVKGVNYTYQKDYVYYNIYPPDGRNEGQLNAKYSEAVTAFRLENQAVFNTMGGWAEGNFELHITAFYLSGTGVADLKSNDKVFSVTPDDIINYDVIENKRCFLGVFFCKSRPNRRFTGVKEYFPSTTYTALVPWDMEVYGNRWLFKTYEFDPDQKKTETVSLTSEVGTNFKVTGGAEIKKVKVGAEFGVETKKTKTETTVYETTLTSNQLGEATLSWSNPIITKVDERSSGVTISIPVNDPLYGLELPVIYKRTAFSHLLATGSLVISVETVRNQQ
jgi:hypothetical protein